MYHTVVDFLSEHLAIAAIMASLLWFYGGHQYFVRGKRMEGMVWQAIGVLVLGAFCVNAVLTRSWYGFTTAVAGIIIELVLMRRRIAVGGVKQANDL